MTAASNSLIHWDIIYNMLNTTPHVTFLAAFQIALMSSFLTSYNLCYYLVCTHHHKPHTGVSHT